MHLFKKHFSASATSHICGTMYAMVLKFQICIACKKLADPYFSSPGPKAPGELIGWWAVRRQSVHTFDQLYLHSMQTDLNHFSAVACLWWGVDDMRFLLKSKENFCFYGNHKVP